MSVRDRINEGRTDLVIGHAAADAEELASLMRTCAYFGDVTAIRYLLTQGATIQMLGNDLGLNGACFHGHWQLTQFVIEQGAKVNAADRQTGETPLHSALSQHERPRHNQVVKVLLAAGANPTRRRRRTCPPAPSCGIAGRRARLRCTARRRSAMKRPCSFCLTGGRSWMRSI